MLQMPPLTKGSFGSLMSVSSSTGAGLLPAQFIDQMLQVGGEERFWTHVLLQPFTDGIADRPACPVIQLIEIVVDSAIHDRFSWASSLAILNEML
jgi:hypothetical protein